MPHIITEFSADFTVELAQNLAKKVQQNFLTLSAEGNFDVHQCKFRFLSFADYYVGLNNHNKSSFVHLTIKILAGRTIEVQKKLTALCMQSLQEIYLIQCHKNRVDFSVDLVEMSKETYQKTTINP
jgi:5-carboxymethyl-2-hydroxymuconate isomerase